jgi:hypothetical protein
MAALPIIEVRTTGTFTLALSCCLGGLVMLTQGCAFNAREHRLVVVESQDVDQDAGVTTNSSPTDEHPAADGQRITEVQRGEKDEGPITDGSRSVDAWQGVEMDDNATRPSSPTVDVLAARPFMDEPDVDVDAASTNNPSSIPGATSGSGHDLSVVTTYSPHDQRARVRLFDDGVQRDAVDFNLKARLPANMTGEAQMASSGFDSQTDKTFQERRNRLLRVRVAGDFSGMNYGVEYRSIGQGFKRAPGMNWRLDQEGTETWVERKFGWVGVKGLLNEYSNNVELDPRRPRTTTVLSGTALTFGTSGTPLVTLSYLQGTSERAGGPLARAQQSTVQQYTASLYYWAPRWEVSLSSTYMPSQDRVHPEYQTEGVYHDAALTIRPTDKLTISPSVTIQTERYRWNGTKSETPMAMLSLLWTSVVERVDLYAFGMYMRSFSTDGWMDTKMTYVQNSLRYDIGREKGQRFLSFDVIYNRYADAVYRIGNTEEVLGRVLFTLTRL